MSDAGAPAAPSLAIALDAMSDAVVDVAFASRRLDEPIHDVLIHDPTAPLDYGRGHVVLGVGVDATDDDTTPPGRSDFARLVEHLGERGGLALVMKSTGSIGPASLAVAADADVALLRIAPHVSWGQLYSLMRSAASSQGTPSSAADIGVRAAPLGDLFSLANAIADAVGGATTIEDRHFGVLAHSNLDHPVDQVRLDSIIGRSVPAGIRTDTTELYRRVWRSPTPIRVGPHAATASRPRLGIAVRAGSEVLGTIWVIEGDEPFSVGSEGALTEAARIAALHLLRHSAGADVERRRRSDQLRAVLDGRRSFESVSAMISPVGPAVFTVAAFEFGRASPVDLEPTGLVERLADSVDIQAEAYRHTSATLAVGRRVYLVMGEPLDGRDGQRRAIMATIAERAAHALRSPIVGGVGATVDAPGSLTQSRRGADDALRIAWRREALVDGAQSLVVHAADALVEIAILRLCDLVRNDPDVDTGLVTRIADFDRRTGSAMVDTLTAYIGAGGRIALAADELNVHPNTLRYRLRKLSEAVGVDVDDADTRFIAELELRIARTPPR
jgi:hypothetical protein